MTSGTVSWLNKLTSVVEIHCGFSPRERNRTTSRSSYLVDPASSHMLVSKIKPCMCKYKHSYCETANGSLNQLSFI